MQKQQRNYKTNPKCDAQGVNTNIQIKNGKYMARKLYHRRGSGGYNRPQTKCELTMGRCCKKMQISFWEVLVKSNTYDTRDNYFSLHSSTEVFSYKLCSVGGATL